MGMELLAEFHCFLKVTQQSLLPILLMWKDNSRRLIQDDRLDLITCVAILVQNEKGEVSTAWDLLQYRQTVYILSCDHRSYKEFAIGSGIDLRSLIEPVVARIMRPKDMMPAIAFSKLLEPFLVGQGMRLD